MRKWSNLQLGADVREYIKQVVSDGIPHRSVLANVKATYPEGTRAHLTLMKDIRNVASGMDDSRQQNDVESLMMERAPPISSTSSSRSLHEPTSIASPPLEYGLQMTLALRLQH